MAFYDATNALNCARIYETTRPIPDGPGAIMHSTKSGEGRLPNLGVHSHSPMAGNGGTLR